MPIKKNSTIWYYSGKIVTDLITAERFTKKESKNPPYCLFIQNLCLHLQSKAVQSANFKPIFFTL